MAKINSEKVLEAINQLPDLERDIEYYIIATESQGEELVKHKPFGFCHTYWHAKKKVLKLKYGIKWYTPTEVCPCIMFD